MVSSALVAPLPPRPRLRFTLAGLFVCLLGIAVGLAYWRATRQIPNALLASFSVWFVFGMLQQINVRLRQLRQSPHLSASIRWGLTLRIATSIGLILLLVATAGREIAQYPWSLGLQQRYSDSWLATQTVIPSAFLLVVIGAYWPPRRDGARERSATRYWRMLLDTGAILVGAAILGVLLVVSMENLSFAWMAIRGVENHLPTRWGGQKFFTTETLSMALVNQFIARGMAAAIMLSVGLAAITLFIRVWHSGRVARRACAILLAACLGGVIWLLNWCRAVALPRLSPTLANEVGYQLPANYLLGSAFLFAACSGLAIRLAVRTPAIDTDEVSGSQTRQPFLHERNDVIAVCLLGILAGIGIHMWNYRLFIAGGMPAFPPLDWRDAWRSLNYFSQYLELHDPARLLSIAAVVVLIHWLWRSFRGDLPRDEQWSVEPRQFAAAWLGSFAILVLAGPVFAWWGFALTLKFYLLL